MKPGLGFALVKNKVAVVSIDDEIDSPDRIVRVLNHYRDNVPGVGAVVLSINSPGGGVAAAQEICEAVQGLKDSDIAVVAALGSVAASGGYYVACPADRIVADAGTLTGSIGVIMETMNAQKILDKIGLQFEVVKSGEFKDSGGFSKAMTSREKAVFQGVIDDVYSQFVDVVVVEREDALRTSLAKLKKIPEKQIDLAEIRAYVKSFSDGRIFSGRKAMELGLVDELGGLDRAIDVAADIAGIDDPQVVTYRESRPFAQWITGISRADIRGWFRQQLGARGRRIGYFAW
ncbi:MAG: signal peptide peptidase SppA [candidate division FCPU426 bacterium]